MACRTLKQKSDVLMCSGKPNRQLQETGRTESTEGSIDIFHQLSTQTKQILYILISICCLVIFALSAQSHNMVLCQMVISLMCNLSVYTIALINSMPYTLHCHRFVIISILFSVRYQYFQTINTVSIDRVGLNIVF